MTNDGAFRIIACDVSSAATKVVELQKSSGVEAQKLVEMLVASVLVRETTAPNRRVQMRLSQPSLPSDLLADTTGDGILRGLQRPGSGEEKTTVLQVTYSLRGGEMHQSIIDAPAEFSVQKLMMKYLQESEQIISVFRLHCHVTDVKTVATGYVVQLLPEAEREGIVAMTRHITEALDVSDNQLPWEFPAELIAKVADGHEYTLLSDEPIKFSCSCSRQRFILGIASLGRDEVENMAKEEESLETVCDGCGSVYNISPHEVLQLMDSRN